MTSPNIDTGVQFSIATGSDRESIYKIRHTVYAEELGQHTSNTSLQLKDDLDDFNIYIVAKQINNVIGFISITPAGAPRFSIDKYIQRSIVPLPFDDSLFEIRLLTVSKSYRSSSLALVLMFAAMRWIETHNGKHVIAICKGDIIDMYLKAGLKTLGHKIQSGNVVYELAIASLEDIKKFQNKKRDLFASLKNRVQWELPFPFDAETCFHGGAFFKAIGEDLQTLEKHNDIINADVLDAWFPPSSKVIEALNKDLGWLLRTSPPTHADGLIDAISIARNVKRECILPGAGSSSLIFLGLKYFLEKNSKVLIIDPCYGEYIHVLENVIGCDVTRFQLSHGEAFEVNVNQLIAEVRNIYEMIIIINPNSPTGKYISKADMHQLLQECKETLVWIDETYIEYTGSENSLEQFASTTDNVIVCKSMSKVYALSGVRSAYICCSPMHVQSLKHQTPPWSVSLPAQLAAITALQDSAYYKSMYDKTHALRNHLEKGLSSLGFTDILSGVANFILFFLPINFLAADEFVNECKKHNLFLRDVKAMGTTLGDRAVRIAVKDEQTNIKMIEIISKVLVKNNFLKTTKS